MRQLILTVITSVLGVGLLTGAASAATVTCNGNISNTGANSTNTVNCVDNNNISVSCNNQGIITENNNQSSTSGSATTSGNTSGGNSTSGSSSNNNTYTVTLGASCAPVSAPSATTGGKGSGTPFTTTAIVAGPTAVKATTPASLPSTGSNSTLETAEIGLGVLAGAAVIAGTGVSVFKYRAALK